MPRRFAKWALLALMLVPSSVRAFVSPGIGQRTGCPLDMVAIPSGSYVLGKKSGNVSIDAFCMDRTEVVVSDYKSCVQSGSCNAEGLDCTYGNYARSGADDHPINCTNWAQATAFCRFRGKRLPTEEEWEWAARGGSRAYKTSWSDGDASATGKLCASIDIPSRNGTCPVRAYPPTELGLYDIVGNVWEWTSSEAGSFDPTNPKFPMWRGGAGWATSTMPDVTLRYDATPDFRHGGVGFRCVKDL